MSVRIVTSPLQGIVSSLCVGVGDEVNEGDVLCLIEAMKMLTPIESDVRGKIIEIYTGEKQAVARDEKIMAIKY